MRLNMSQQSTVSFKASRHELLWAPTVANVLFPYNGRYVSN